MRRPRFGLAVALGLFLLVPTHRVTAQTTTGNFGLGVDPFSLYYGYYLPHQAAIAAQPTPLDTINAVTAARQFTAATDRAALYDPISPYAEEDIDPFSPYGARRARERGIQVPQSQLMQFAAPTTRSSNAQGNGPPLYYNRVARYYPTLKPGRGPNRNIAVQRASRGGFGGMPSMPSTPGLR